jgi:small GTP-binding protein
MPANLPPQFFEIQSKLKSATTKEEKIEIYEKLIAICPKHKGTERVLEDLKRKIAKLKKEKEKKVRSQALYFVKKEGAGQVIIGGPQNSGKSSLLNSLTNAKAAVSDYPFTTKSPQPGMMPFENIQIQLVDTPPLSKEFSLGWLKNIYRGGDGILILFDLSQENVIEKIKEIEEILKNWEINKEKVLFVGNKIDLPRAKENFEKLKEKIKIAISTENKIGLESLKKEIFNLLGIIRVYSKPPQKEPDLKKPFIFKKNSTILDLIKEINPDLISRFKMAKLFKENIKSPRIVGKDYILKDGDIIEIRT